MLDLKDWQKKKYQIEKPSVKVRVLCIDADGYAPIITIDNAGIIRRFDLDGSGGNCTLINSPPEPVTIIYYANLYRDSNPQREYSLFVHSTKEQAERTAGLIALVVAHPINITFTPKE